MWWSVKAALESAHGTAQPTGPMPPGATQPDRVNGSGLGNQSTTATRTGALLRLSSKPMIVSNIGTPSAT